MHMHTHLQHRDLLFFVGIYGTRAVFSLRFALLQTKGFKGEKEKINYHF